MSRRCWKSCNYDYWARGINRIISWGIRIMRDSVTKLGSRDVFLSLTLRKVVGDRLVSCGSFGWYNSPPWVKRGAYHHCPGWQMKTWFNHTARYLPNFVKPISRLKIQPMAGCTSRNSAYGDAPATKPLPGGARYYYEASDKNGKRKYNNPNHMTSLFPFNTF